MFLVVDNGVFFSLIDFIHSWGLVKLVFLPCICVLGYVDLCVYGTFGNEVGIHML